MGSDSSKLKPQELEDLKAQTFLEEDEIIDWYKQFLKDHPSGFLETQEFEKLYTEVFPHGDASKFAQHVFRTFDHDRGGTIDFKEFICALNITRRGTVRQKLRWAFNLYDIDGDGVIVKKEMYDILKAIEIMAGSSGGISKRQIKEAFKNMDKNDDGKLTFEEFLAGAQDYPAIVDMLQASST